MAATFIADMDLCKACGSQFQGYGLGSSSLMTEIMSFDKLLNY
jgi:hypothetical protein